MRLKTISVLLISAIFLASLASLASLATKQIIKAPLKIIKTPRLHVSESFIIPGQDGLIEKGQLVKKPLKTIKVVGTSEEERMYMMKRPMRVKKTLKMRATSYYPGPEDCSPYADGFTYLDYKAGYGVVAVDPRVIPLKSRVYVEGYGFALAVDIGSAIKGKRIDVCFDTLEESKRYGLKWVKVHILE